MTAVGVALLAPVWLTLPAESGALILWAGGFYFSWGVLIAGLSFGQTRAMVGVVPRELQGEGFAVTMYSSAFGGGLGGLFGGFAFSWVGGLPLLGEGALDPKLLYLAGVQGMMLPGWYLSRRLVGHADQTPTRDVLRRVVRASLGTDRSRGSGQVKGKR